MDIGLHLNTFNIDILSKTIITDDFNKSINSGFKYLYIKWTINKDLVNYINSAPDLNKLSYPKLPDDIVARVEGRSSMGRLGVTMHVTAGYIDPGFEGKITLEISNIGAMPVALYPGQRVCQVVFETMTSPSEIPYGHPSRNSKYMGQERPESSRIKMDYELKK